MGFVRDGSTVCTPVKIKEHRTSDEMGLLY